MNKQAIRARFCQYRETIRNLKQEVGALEEALERSRARAKVQVYRYDNELRATKHQANRAERKLEEALERSSVTICDLKQKVVDLEDVLERSSVRDQLRAYRLKTERTRQGMALKKLKNL